ncbi:MAG: Uma2 family endonuclease [Polyangiaceae bacterium]|nr:Uma2 family endonuclease [Polyangiaceae bacterium]
MSDPARRATYQDLLDTPPHYTAEIVKGVLHTNPRPARSYRNAASVLSGELYLPFRRGIGGPGKWALLDEPELHLGSDPDILVPDIAGWRRERMPRIPLKDAAIFLAPDWVCEVLSPATEAIDRSEKMDIYARESVALLWFVDPRPQTLEVYRNESGRWSRVGAWRGAVTVRAEPFDAADLELGVLWQD